MPSSTEKWTLHTVPDASNTSQRAHFFEARKGSSITFRTKHAIDPTQPTANPGGASGDPSHEQWLQENVCYRPNDVVIATFPKCGTTLAENVVLLLLNGGDMDKMDPLSKNSVQYGGNSSTYRKIWPEGCLVPAAESLPPGRPHSEEFAPVTLAQFESLPQPRVIKTHAPQTKLLRGGLPLEGPPRPARYIVVTRNPLDACVSSYYHAWNPHKSGWPFEAWAAAWLGGAEEFGSWFDWHNGWYRLMQKPPEGVQILWLHYEDIIATPSVAIKQIAEFIGVQADDDLIDRVVAGSSFASMKSAAEKAEKAAISSGARPVASSAHLRNGKAGDWRSYFSADMRECFELAFATSMSGCSDLVYSLGHGESMSVESALTRSTLGAECLS